ncbi:MULTISPECIES: hypothetical protein [unclassified Halomonas]|uniref:hypothetical protein n=1 Tax=unclassified Halomonas TaxID=2609666 RepID=UPI0009905CE5|nr:MULTISPECIES: hypothetical protein [unclassified Halomonas]AQU83243.1 hypothetical protein B2G49_12105 [Halomonas sp. 'Soap Lake \
MGRRATKRIHYVRAVYNEGYAPERSFSDMVREILTRSASVAATEIYTESLGTIAIREKHSNWKDPKFPILLALGAGTANEKMSTMGIGVQTDVDQDGAERPPQQRAFKTADAFVLIDGFDLLVCTDGAMRGYKSVWYYLANLFDKYSLDPKEQAFDLQPRSNQVSVETVSNEGVKFIELSGVLYQSTNAPAKKNTFAENIFGRLTDDLQGWLEGSLPKKDRNIASDQWAEMNITTTIKPTGGKKAEPVLLESMKRASLEMLEDVPGTLDITLITKEGNKVTPMDVTLSKTFQITRRQARNDLATFDVWAELENYRAELIERKAWRK